jgi:hypothetical protein
MKIDEAERSYCFISAAVFLLDSLASKGKENLF